MATKSFQAQAPPMATESERAGGRRVARAMLPPPRRGQIKEQIIKEIVAAVSGVIAGRGRSDQNGGGGGVSVSDENDK